MKISKTLIGLIMVLAAALAIVYGCYFVMNNIWEMYTELDAILRLIVLSSFAVFMVGCLVIGGAMKAAAQIKLKGELTNAKISLYNSVADLCERYFAGARADKTRLQQDILNKLAAVTTELNVIADSSVIERYRKLVIAFERREEDDKLHTLYQQLIRSMRLDLGHGTRLGETRLKFLLNNVHSSKEDATSHGISA